MFPKRNFFLNISSFNLACRLHVLVLSFNAISQTLAVRISFFSHICLKEFPNDLSVSGIHYGGCLCSVCDQGDQGKQKHQRDENDPENSYKSSQYFKLSSFLIYAVEGN